MAKLNTTLLPIGSIEYHGGHCPTNSDTLIAERLANRIKEALFSDAEITVLPAIPIAPITSTRFHSESKYISPLDFIKKVIETVKACKTKTLFVVSGHWGSAYKAAITVAAEEICNKFGIDVYVFDWLTISEVEGIEVGHAGEQETSIGLVLYPNKVKKDYKTKEAKKSPKLKNKFIYTKCVTHPVQFEYVGDPKKASKEKGKLIVDTITKNCSKTIIEVLK